MFGITPLGWVHTLGSLPAIPLALYMFARHGRIEPRSAAGLGYLASMTLGAASVFLVARHPEAPAIAALTLAALGLGYGLALLRNPGRLAQIVQTVSLSLSTLLLMVPTVTETLTRVPDGAPFAASPQAPLVLGAQGTLVALFLLGLVLQLRRR